MAHHRSPSGAEPATGARRDVEYAPAPRRRRHRSAAPQAPWHGRAALAAVTTGATVAAAHSLISWTPTVESYEVSLASGALIQGTSPVADAPQAAAVPPSGPSRRTAELAVLDHDADVADVRSLTKAVAVGEKLAAEAAGAARLKDALAGGSPVAALFGGERFVKPAAGTFTSGFGARWGTHHYGIDIADRVGTPIYAVTDGTVVDSGPASGFGLWVRVKHPDGGTSVYGHINRSLVRVGQKVRAGQQIAEMGNRGQSTGPHLHFEVWDSDDRKLNPLAWLASRGIRVTGSADPR